MQYQYILWLKLLFYLLIVACSQGARLDMDHTPKHPLSDAMARGEQLKKNNPTLANFVGKVYNNDIKGVKTLLEAEPSLVLEPIDTLGTTVLGIAACKGFKEMIEYLLTYRGHNFKQICDQKEGNGLLIMAILSRNPEIVKRFLQEQDSGLDINQPNKYGHTPLGVAIGKKQFQMVELLVSSKATIKIEHLFIFICCKKSYIKIADVLLNHMENKSEMIAQKYKRLSLLLFAVTCKNSEFIQLLIKHGAAASPLLDECNKALVLATNSGYDVIVRLLLEAGANPNIETGTENKTALMIAAGQGHTKIAAMLIKNKQTDIVYINMH